MVTTLDAIRFSSDPVAITHAGCKAVFDHSRNKTDEALREMADGGGVLGIVQVNPCLGSRERSARRRGVACLRGHDRTGLGGGGRGVS